MVAVRLGRERRPKQQDLRIVPAGVNDPQFPVPLVRNRGRDAVRDRNRRDLFRRGRGGWSHNVQIPKTIGVLTSATTLRGWRAKGAMEIAIDDP